MKANETARERGRIDCTCPIGNRAKRVRYLSILCCSISVNWESKLQLSLSSPQHTVMCGINSDYSSIYYSIKWICSKFPIGHLNLNARAKEMGNAACKATATTERGKRRSRRGRKEEKN